MSVGNKLADLFTDDTGNHITVIDIECERNPHIQCLFQNAQRTRKVWNVIDVFSAVIATGERLWFIITEPFQFYTTRSACGHQLGDLGAGQRLGAKLDR